MALLLDRRGDEFRITDEVVKEAALNEEVMALLLDRRGDEVRITDEVVKAAADETEVLDTHSWSNDAESGSNEHMLKTGPHFARKQFSSLTANLLDNGESHPIQPGLAPPAKEVGAPVIDNMPTERPVDVKLPLHLGLGEDTTFNQPEHTEYLKGSDDTKSKGSGDIQGNAMAVVSTPRQSNESWIKGDPRNPVSMPQELVNLKTHLLTLLRYNSSFLYSENCQQG
jgi:hypothetical protein